MWSFLSFANDTRCPEKVFFTISLRNDFSLNLLIASHTPPDFESRFELIFLLVWVLIVVNHAVALFSALSHCIRNFLGSGAFFWRRESWWKSGGGFLALSPPLPTPIMGFFGLRWGEKVPGRDFMLQPSQIKLKYVGAGQRNPTAIIRPGADKKAFWIRRQHARWP